MLPCESTDFFSLCLVCGRLSFLLSKNHEHLIRSLEHVGESWSRETSQELGKPQETCGWMGLWPGRGLSWAVQAVWSKQAQHRPIGSHLLSLPSSLFNLLHCPRLGFLGSKLTLSLVYRGYIRECSWDQHLGKGRKGEKRWRGEGRGEVGLSLGELRLGCRLSGSLSRPAESCQDEIITLQSWSKLGGTGLDLYSPHQSHTWCWPPQEKSMTLGERRSFQLR